MIRSLLDKNEAFWLTPFGMISATCKYLVLTSPIQIVRASFEQGSGYGNSIQFEKDEKKKTYGNLPEQQSLITEWVFTENSYLIGMHGRMDDEGKITQIGFISRNTGSDCPVSVPPIVEEEQDTPIMEEEENPSIEEEGDRTIEEEEEDAPIEEEEDDAPIEEEELILPTEEDLPI